MLLQGRWLLQLLSVLLLLLQRLQLELQMCRGNFRALLGFAI